MTLTANLFGKQPIYVPSASRSAALDDANMHTVGAGRFGQRCQVQARLHASGTTPAEVRITAGDGGSVGNLSGSGGRIISTDDVEPLELYVPSFGYAVAAQKLRADDPDSDVFIYSIDNSGETAKFPPLKVNSSEAIATGSDKVNVVKPPDTADSDLMIALVGVDSDAVEPDLTAGWAWLGGTAAAARVIAGANPTLRVAWKLAYAEGANYDWGKAASTQTWAAAIITVRMQGANSESNYGLTAFNSASYGAKNGTSDSLTIGLWLTERIKLDADTRFAAAGATGAPITMILLAGAYNSSTPGDAISQMASANNFTRNGGGDMKGNEMLAIGSLVVTSPSVQLAGVKLVASASHFEYQAASLTLIPS